MTQLELIRLTPTAWREYREIGLWVAADNAPAERLYGRLGFVRTGQVQPVTPNDPTRREFAMVRVLDTELSSQGRSMLRFCAWPAPAPMPTLRNFTCSAQ